MLHIIVSTLSYPSSFNLSHFNSILTVQYNSKYVSTRAHFFSYETNSITFLLLILFLIDTLSDRQIQDFYFKIIGIIVWISLTFPVGLCGEFRISILVLGFIALYQMQIRKWMKRLDKAKWAVRRRERTMALHKIWKRKLQDCLMINSSSSFTQMRNKNKSRIISATVGYIDDHQLCDQT